MLPIVAEKREVVRTTPKLKPKPDHAPSKLNYRLERLWLTRWFRDMVRIWLPFGAFIVVAYAAYASPGTRGWLGMQVETARSALAARPELRIERVSIPVGSPDLQRQILGIMELELPVSALDVDLAELRDMVQGLSAVKSASVRFHDDGVLEVSIIERMPSMVWRNLNRIYLLDENGVKVAELPRRSVRADLPLVVGVGANAAILEAREIYAVLTQLEGRVLGLVRMGERRWDVVLQNKLVKLPEVGAANALRALMAMQARDDVLDRDAAVIDMRDPNRMILRLNAEALSELRRVRDRVHGERV